MNYFWVLQSRLTRARSPTEKTIEGDLFAAFVAAGAISKANADDPQKSSLIRCARTDKGVHAAGNLISMKLILEEPNIVTRINEKLSPQIRVWGIERTSGSFNAYQLCDSRIYEYLIPTYCFLPPHPRSFLGKQIREMAQEASDIESYEERQNDASKFWSELETNAMMPVFKGQNQKFSELVLRLLYENHASSLGEDPKEIKELQRFASSLGFQEHEPPLTGANDNDTTASSPKPMTVSPEQFSKGEIRDASPLGRLLRRLKDVQLKAKKAYRIHPDRLSRVHSVFARYVGTHKFHNYTIDKTSKDASATRTIRSFVVNPNPIIINDTEWLSLKVHGQSFMMHQIRKMVSLACLIVRCGCHEDRIDDTYSQQRLSIPKAPSLGLLLERPVFDPYNRKLEDLGRASIDFGRYEKEIEEFKQREIYQRMFRAEEEDNTFHIFFSSLDQARSSQLLYLSSLGLEAVKRDVHTGIGKDDQKDAAAADGREDERASVRDNRIAHQDDVDAISVDDEERDDEA